MGTEQILRGVRAFRMAYLISATAESEHAHVTAVLVCLEKVVNAE